MLSRILTKLKKNCLYIWVNIGKKSAYETFLCTNHGSKDHVVTCRLHAEIETQFPTKFCANHHTHMHRHQHMRAASPNFKTSEQKALQFIFFKNKNFELVH
jgi:hypothetical protein